MNKSEAGKGDSYRPVNKKAYDKGWNKAFNKSWWKRFKQTLNKIDNRLQELRDIIGEPR